MKKIAMLAAAAAVMALTGSARAAEVEVKLLNKGSDGAVMVFEPAFVKIAPGEEASQPVQVLAPCQHWTEHLHETHQRALIGP